MKKFHIEEAIWRGTRKKSDKEKEEKIIKILEAFREERQEIERRDENPSVNLIVDEYGVATAEALRREFWAGFQTAINIIRNL